MSAPRGEQSAASSSASAGATRGRVWDRLGYGMTFAVLAAVFGVGSWLDWKMPKRSEIFDQVPHEEKWCPEHAVPESACVECNPNLLPRPASFGWCEEHGVMDCVIHHPELAQVQGPPTMPAYDTVKALGVMDRSTNDRHEPFARQRLQLASSLAVQQVGLEFAKVEERRMADVVQANGELTFDPTRVVHLSTRVQGTVALVLKSLGAVVVGNETLALVDAASVGQAKSSLLQSIVQVRLRKATVDRLQSITDSGAVAQKSLLEAQAALQEAEISLISARQSLTNLGFSYPEGVETRSPEKLAEDLQFLGIEPAALDLLPPGMRTSNLLPIRAPYAGTIVASDIVAGEVVDSKSTLFTVADPSQMWLVLNVKQEDARHVRPGLVVRFQTEDGDLQVEGTVAWISPAVDEQTRTLRVRVNVGPSAGVLRDRTYGTGQIILRDEPRAMVVPIASVQSTGNSHYVFVRDKNWEDEKHPRLFYARQVRLGPSDQGYIEILAGVLPGEWVSTKGSPVLLAQLLRSQLGNGHEGDSH